MSNISKFPIGEFHAPAILTSDLLNGYIHDISSFPLRLKEAVAGLSDQQLDTPYRPDGWTIRQVVHHCADSHMNSLIRFKLALTEDQPTIKPYYEERWAELADSKKLDISPSLLLLEGLHRRWTVLLNALTKEELSRTFVHPEHGKIFRLDENIGVYAWHCNHHLAHITTLKKSKDW
ncbi:MAG: hypothetical protein JWO58_1282 [Chitinophagaceae bacterium]|nr:hypothetical protein [Chitinophagaceae bacterium]